MMLTVYLATSQPDLVDFMIKVVARKKAESEDAAPGPSRAFAIGSEFESLLPQGMFHGISEESARRALAMEDRNKRIVTTLRGALSRSDHHTEEASLVARGRAQEKPQEDRLTVVVRYLVKSKFFLAAVPAIGALTQNKTNQLRVRSGKGANAGLLSELRLLADIQSTGLLKVIVRKKPGQAFSYFVRKYKYEDVSQEDRLLLAKGLTNFGLTMDEYRANASTGSIDSAFSDIGAPIATELPYGLQVIESGTFLPTATQDFLRDKDGDDNGGDKENSDAVVMSPGKGSPSSSDKGTMQPRTATPGPPPATQVRGGSYGKAEDDSDEEESGDELHQNKRNCCE